MVEKIYSQSPWSLKDLFESFEDPKIEESYKALSKNVEQFESYREQLSNDLSSEKFLEIIGKLEEGQELAYRLYGFSSLSFAANTQDQKAQIGIARVQQFLAEVENRTLFFSLWWKALDDQNAARLLDVSGDYRYWLEQIRNFKPYTLSEPEEKIINIKNVTGTSAMDMLYDSITNRYVFKVEVDGETKELTRGELMSLVRTSDPDLRARAYQELYRVYGEDANILGQIYQNIVRDWKNENVGLRGFASPISVRNTINDLPDEVIETLLEVARQNIGIFHRYFKLKASKIGMEKLRRYDIYAPVSESDKRYNYDEATAMTFEAFERFDPKFAQLARRVFDEEHVDSEVRKGKMGGAFCSTLGPKLTPWVMLNYQGKADDVSTMAHELGHAIHSMMAEEHSIFTQHACLPLAETASTFGEMTLTDLLLERETDEGVKQDILFGQLDDAFATIIRQIYFALFEREAHEMIANNASVDELNEAYLANLKEEFGDSVDVSDEFKYEWVSIPHIYGTPFYVYAYAFGQLLVFALYKRYQEEGESFKPKYLRILSAGGSVAPIPLLAEAGMDVTKAEFWQGGFDVIEGMVEKLESL
ncbi:MAG: M3 family oligoendopeptidase [Anaerolineaceae bacterium]|nr:M3 family oligoendopeptidase [Anaerolineaceae bacterium]MDD4577865.1 M3 family oligoendopeptidase [Anaerolineaceae bacterium]